MKQPKQTVNKVFSPHHQRVLSVAVSIILQFSLYALVLFRFSRYFVYFYWSCFAISLLVALFISTRKTKLAYKVAWIVPILLLPVIGGMTYLMFGGARRPHYHREETRRTFQRELPATLSTTDLMRYGPDALQQAWYLGNTALCPAYTNTETAYFPSGKEFLQDYLAELEKAQDYIFLEYFIISEGSMWDEILEVLTRKAAQGVDVRVLYDGMLEISTLPWDYPRRLEKLGIRCKAFAPIQPFLSTHYNYRDHRKILVIDGKVAFTGGVNLADEYINRKERFGHWKDTAILLRGEAVQSFTLMFLQMWNLTEKEPRWDEALLPSPPVEAEGYVMPYCDCPLDDYKVGESVYMDILNRAKDYVHIMTPYLILDNEMETALKFAAQRGVDVKLILPGIPDKKAAYALAKSHYQYLTAAGVKLYEYTPGFVHAKIFASDDVKAVVGTINLDYRSLYHHFECAAYLYGGPTVGDVERDFQRTLEQCRRVTPETIRHEKLGYKLGGSLMKLVAPLL